MVLCVSCQLRLALTSKQGFFVVNTCCTRDTCASRLASALIFLGIPCSFSVLNSILLVPDGVTLICRDLNLRSCRMQVASPHSQAAHCTWCMLDCVVLHCSNVHRKAAVTLTARYSPIQHGLLKLCCMHLPLVHCE